VSQRYQPPTKERIEAFAASLVVWLLALARDVIAHPFDLRRVMKRAERAVECVLFLMAARNAVPPPASAQRVYLRRSAPPGFRRRSKTSRLLFKHARVRLRTGGILQRLARLISALATPQRYVARFSKLLGTGLRGSRLIAISPRASAVTSQASQLAHAVDSS
jgi:hypothetical protein